MSCSVDVLGVVDDLAAQPVARVVEVARHLGLAVDHDGLAAGIFREIDAVEQAVVGDEEAVMDLALAVHALAALGLAHQLGEAVLEHAGADAAEHVFAALPLEHDVSMPLRCSSCDSSSPDGPPPMMQTCTRMGVRFPCYCAVSPPSTISSTPVVKDEFVAREIEDGVGDLLRLAHAAHRRGALEARAHPLGILRTRDALEHHRRFGERGMDGIQPDVVAGAARNGARPIWSAA